MKVTEVPADPIRIAMRVAEILDRIGVPYAIGGSVASVIAGEPRSTEGVDLAADLKPEQVPAFVAALGVEFYVDGAAAGEAAVRSSPFNIIHLESMQKVDVFVLGPASSTAGRSSGAGSRSSPGIRTAAPT